MDGHNIEANAILSYAINPGLSLTGCLDDASVTSKWLKYEANTKVGR
jgi:hypothetical protein